MTAGYSATILEHFRRPRRHVALGAPTGAAEAANPLCGDRVRVEVVVADGVVRQAGFRAEACAVCVAAGSLLLERVEGATLASARALTEADALALLDAALPPSRVRCATLALEALRAALGAAREAEPAA